MLRDTVRRVNSVVCGRIAVQLYNILDIRAFDNFTHITVKAIFVWGSCILVHSFDWIIFDIIVHMSAATHTLCVPDFNQYIISLCAFLRLELSRSFPLDCILWRKVLSPCMLWRCLLLTCVLALATLCNVLSPYIIFHWNLLISFQIVLYYVLSRYRCRV